MSESEQPRPTDVNETPRPEANSRTGRFAGNFLVRWTHPRIPFQTRLWKWWLKTGYRGLLKATGGDAINHTYRPNGKVDIEPIRYEAGATEDGDPLWITPDRRDWWVPSGEGPATGPGRVPLTWGSSDYYALSDELQARTDMGFRLGDHGPIYREASFDVINMSYEEAAQPEAATDGGTPGTVVGQDLRLSQAGVLDDYYVDLSDTDRRILSLWGYKNTHPERMGSEEHDMAEWRGYQAAKEEDGPDMLKILIVAGAIIVLTVAAVMFFTGGGGGGGGVSIGGGGGGSLIPSLSIWMGGLWP